MTGTVTRQGEAVVQVRVEDAAGRPRDVAALVDTGFTGFIALPSARIAALGLPFAGLKRVTLADGSQAELAVSYVVLHWYGRRLRVPALETQGGTLIGMRLLQGSRLAMDVVAGGLVEILPVARP